MEEPRVEAWGVGEHHIDQCLTEGHIVKDLIEHDLSMVLEQEGNEAVVLMVHEEGQEEEEVKN